MIDVSKVLLGFTFLVSILFNFSVSAAEKIESSELLSVIMTGNLGIHIRQNDDLFTKNNTKLDKVYGFSISGEIAPETGFGIRLDAGYRVDNQRKKADLPNAYRLVETSMYTLLLGSSYYYDSSSDFKTYLNFAAGIAKVNVNFNHSKPPSRDENAINKIKFAYSAEIGKLVKLSENFALGAGLQYFGIADLQKEDLNPKYPTDLLDGESMKIGETSIVMFAKISI